MSTTSQQPTSIGRAEIVVTAGNARARSNRNLLRLRSQKLANSKGPGIHVMPGKQSTHNTHANATHVKTSGRSIFALIIPLAVALVRSGDRDVDICSPLSPLNNPDNAISQKRQSTTMSQATRHHAGKENMTDSGYCLELFPPSHQQ